MNAAAIVAKVANGPDPLSGSRSLHSKVTSDSSISVARDADMVCARFPLAKSGEDVSDLAGGDLEATEYNSNFPPLRPSGSPGSSLSGPN